MRRRELLAAAVLAGCTPEKTPNHYLKDGLCGFKGSMLSGDYLVFQPEYLPDTHQGSLLLVTRGQPYMVVVFEKKELAPHQSTIEQMVRSNIPDASGNLVHATSAINGGPEIFRGVVYQIPHSIVPLSEYARECR